MKRLNPETKKIFKRGDVREDDYTFLRYRVERPIKKNGNFIEDWRRPSNKNEGKKRINKKTGLPFKKGDYNEKNNKYFWGWDSNGCDKNGYRYEIWVSGNTYEHKHQKMLEGNRRHKEKIKKAAETGAFERRINPLTGEYFKRGEQDARGRYFISYARNSLTDGYIGEEWGDYSRLVRTQIGLNRFHASKRAKKKNIAFDLSTDYLISIYPRDEICPIFGFKMEWLGNKQTSPSIDRIVPELGYIEGNVAWISNRANVLKLNRAPDILRKIADWIDSQTKDSLVEKDKS